MSKHVLIVGGGVVGLCVAYYCARRGFRVTLVERNAAIRNGCSYGNAGMVVPSHFVPLAAPGMVALGLKWMWNPASPFYVKPRLSADLIDWGWKFWRAATPEHVRRAAPLLRDLTLASRAEFEMLAALPGADLGFTANGLLLLCNTRHALEEETRTAEVAHTLGIDARVLDPAQTAAQEPGMRMDIEGAIHYPGDRHLVPHRLMALLQREVASAHVDCRWNTEIAGWRVERGRHVRAIVTGEGDEIEADEFVLCGGVWSPLLVRELGLKLPMQAGKGYSLTLTAPPRLPAACAILSEARVGVTPMAGALRFAGTMEIAGRDERINPIRVRGIIEAATRYYPDFAPSDFADVKPWSGLRPCTPDGLPYVGRVGRLANLAVAAGHAMMGTSLGPITGKLMAGMLDGEPAGIDLSLLSPDRY